MPIAALLAGVLAAQVGAEMTPHPAWFSAKWQSTEKLAFEAAAFKKKPVLIWVPERDPFGLQTKSSLQARESILSSPDGLHMMETGRIFATMNAHGGFTRNDEIDKAIEEPGAYVFFPDGKLAKKLPSSDVKSWPGAALEVEALLAKSPIEWKAPTFEFVFICGVVDMTPKRSLWCIRSGDQGQEYGYQVWMDRDLSVRKLVESGQKEGLLPFAKQFFIDSSQPSPSAWKDREVKMLKATVLSPGRGVMVDFEMQSEDGSRGMKGRAVFSRTEHKYSDADVSGQATSWRKSTDGSKAEYGVRFMSGPLFRYQSDVSVTPRGLIDIRPSWGG